MLKALVFLLIAASLCHGEDELVELDADELEMESVEAEAAKEDLAKKTKPHHWNDHVWMAGYNGGQVTIGGKKPRDFFKIGDWDELYQASTNPDASKFVRQKKQVYYSIDPAKSMKQMGEVGSLLRLSYAGTKGYKSSSLVLRLLSGYQDLVKHSLVTASTFVEIALRSLRYHKVAFIFIEHGKVEKSLHYLGKTEEMAIRIAEECQTIIDKCDEMVKLATDALIGVNDDHVATVEERKKITELINKLKVEEARQKQMKTDIDAMVAEFRSEEKRNEANAESKTNWGLIMDIFSPLADKVISIGLCKLGESGDQPLLAANDDGGFPDGGFPDGGTDGGFPDGGTDGGPPPDGGTDGGFPDGGTDGGTDGGFPDGGTGGTDGGFPDGGTGGTDGGFPDGGTGGTDGGFPDGGTGGTDGGFPDGGTGGTDGGFPDGGTGGTDGGFPDGGTGGTGGGGLGGCATADNGQLLPRGDKMHQLANAARERERAAREARIEWQKKQLDNNAELAATVQKLANAKNSKDELDKAIFGLDLAIKSLGRVKTIFLNAQVFWIGVQKHAKSLRIDQEEIRDYAEDEDLRAEYLQAAIDSGLSWVAIGSILREAALQIRKVDEGVDEVMSDLPTESEARTLIEELRREITNDIRKSNEEIKKELKSEKNKLPLPNKVKLPIMTDKLTLPEIKDVVYKIKHGGHTKTSCKKCNHQTAN